MILRDRGLFLVGLLVQCQSVSGLSIIGPRIAVPTKVSYSEVFIGNASSNVDTEGKSVGERIKYGESVLELRHLASREECDWLTNACLQAAEEEEEEANPTRCQTKLDNKPGLIRLPTVAAAERATTTQTPCVAPLPSDIDRVLQTILRRAAEYVDQELPSVTSVLFRTDSITDLLTTNRLQFSSREPAINVYTQGGEFLAHKDGQALTVLLPLSCPEEDFTGGGTAFWHQDARGHRVEGPSLVCKPPGGTAMLFGGCVTHAGISVESGSRVVFVASFSPKSRVIETK